MCGIAGLMTTDGNTPPQELLERLHAALAHRGPDGSGYYLNGNVGLMQARLAVIDLVTGDQPFVAPVGTALVGNGEIYNYIELKAGLPEVDFATQSDCEVPLHLYCRDGLDFTRALRGMYALAIHDPGAGHLVLARDPFGIKPLYYVETRSCFAFASEPEALIRAGLAGAAVLRQSRNELLQLQFTTGRDTIYADIKRLLPGETLVVVEGRLVERRRREALPSGAPVPMDAETALSALDRVLRDAVRLHQRSDVPYGMFLSGGIDSTALLSLMAELNERPVKAFTIGFPSAQATDERPAARAAAESVGAEHVEIEFREADFWTLLPEVAAALDDPTADYAILPTWKLARTAQEAGLKVILSGEGGDELFAGYGRYRSVMRPWWAGGKMLRARGNFDGLGLLRSELTGWRDGMLAADVQAAGEGRTRLQVAQATDCADWLPNDLLTKLDRCLMGFGIEGRTPFLDSAVADFAFRLPDDLKIRDGLGKWLLRRWLQTRMPAADALARKKGFTVPVADWLRRRGAMLGPLVARQPGIQEICVPDAVERLFLALDQKRHGFAAWSLLFYALWHRAHVQRLAPERDVFQTLSASG
jgi:asparagine synthase (glutamine-hydrolysing)